jgi:hypothetical protein
MILIHNVIKFYYLYKRSKTGQNTVFNISLTYQKKEYCLQYVSFNQECIKISSVFINFIYYNENLG